VTDVRETLEAGLRDRSAVLFRGVRLHTPDAFGEWVRTQDGTLLDYDDQHTPRTHLGGQVYSSTEYAADRTIPFHSENSKNRRWPQRLWLHCLEAPEAGGETPLADNRSVYRHVDVEIRKEFQLRGLMYVRNCPDGPGPGVSWQQAFACSDRPSVERVCLARGMDFEWRGGGTLHLRYRAPAVRSHPETGEPLWFNQAHLFHWSVLPEDVREALLGLVGWEGLPSNAVYADGTPIESAAIDEVRAAYDACAWQAPWRRDDLLVVDNMRIAHGRRPYRGRRRVVVAMTRNLGT
jgi:alpha-ketoglutarate-dependent taurine dioxygenase